MKRQTAQWIRKAEDDVGSATALAGRRTPYRDQVCFHCQQAAEKYLKALLQESGTVVPKTHNLNDLLDLLLPIDATLAPLRRSCKALNRYAVEYRYPGTRATTRGMRAALAHSGRIRQALRARLGLSP